MKSEVIYRSLLEDITSRLEAVGIETPRTEAEIIVSELLECSRPELVWNLHEKVPLKILNSAEGMTVRREQHEPLQYIIGEAHFMHLTLNVNPDVLIPRPETELLVEKVCKIIPADGTLLDLGTGSGAIALAAAYERMDIKVTAVDVSINALEVARQNQMKYDMDNVEFIESNLFSALQYCRFDCIAANLPYVANDEYKVLMPEVRLYEPALALTAPDRGLGLIFKAIKNAHKHLKPGGYIIFEHGIHQAAAVRKALHAAKHFIDIETIQDYSNRDRFTAASFSL
ncbi:peptide chain release factor N(5)-glutamine methyltransferase [Lentisphaerota bacterium ZTH]|nr:peptide chain release factor N(5)-glutamine methyltransferase [Lentisphaerota bacterium]WET06531.1 peptide chain release factor N(5)-glutamine methyltransferase [Lentisphaerota bacterium ZTH]